MEYRMEYRMEELLPIVRELTEKYTGRESTSVTYERAQQLMGAVLYCIREGEQSRLRSGQTGQTALGANGDGFTEEVHRTAGANGAYLQTGFQKKLTAREAYQQGYQRIQAKIFQANERYIKILEGFDSFGNLACEDTVRQGMTAFFQRYDIRFAPQDHIITMDYPVLFHMEKLQGVDAVERYLECIQAEQVFLKSFPGGYVRNILISWNQDYEELFINLCSVILGRVLASMMLGKNLESGRLEAAEYKQLGEIINGFTREELKRRLTGYLNILVKQSCPGHSEVFSYLKEEIEELTTSMINGAQQGALHCIC